MKIEDQIDKLVSFLDSEREKHEGVGLADFHIECITVAYNQGRTDKENELTTDKEEVQSEEEKCDRCGKVDDDSETYYIANNPEELLCKSCAVQP